MIHSAKENAQYIAQLAQRNHIKDLVFSPGSRNAPLVIEFGNNPFFNTFTVADERVAAFMALGMSLQTGHPSMIICTSGSALLNYYPAVAEAFYQNIPLVVVSADRPSEWIDQADGQTIRQADVFKNHILKSVTLFKDGGDQQSKDFNQRVINEAINTAIEKQGPVHINVPFEEPLYNFAPAVNKVRKIDLVHGSKLLDQAALQKLTHNWESAKSKLVIVGQLPYNHNIGLFLEELSKDPSVAILTETTSNATIPETFPCIDRIIDVAPETLTQLKPEILLTLGGAIVSKKVKAFLRNNKPLHHFNVTDKNLEPDTFQALTLTIRSSAHDFLKQFKPQVNPNAPTYRTFWMDIHLARQQKHHEYLDQLPYSDMWVFDQINRYIPNNSFMHWANSTAIRYAQLFEYNKSIKHFCNRGTSGIDGSTSTALGFALKSNQTNILVTGDVSFFYDSNAFFHNHVAKNFKVIVINNQGGGIFRFIPGPDTTPQLETVFTSAHTFTAEGIAYAYQVPYTSANSKKSLATQLENWLNKPEKYGILEIFTPKEDNALMLKEYFNHLKKHAN